MPYIRLKSKNNTVARLVRPRPTASGSFKVFRSEIDDFRAYIHREVIDSIIQHAEKGGVNEVIGLLAGRICLDPATGPYTVIMVAGEAHDGEFQSNSGEVELLAEGLDKVRSRIEDTHPDREVVGWYHTHPNCQPTFSKIDTREQRSWSDPNHIGIVYSSRKAGEPFGVYRGPKATLLTPAQSGATKSRTRSISRTVGDGSRTAIQTSYLPQPLLHDLTPPQHSDDHTPIVPAAVPAVHQRWRHNRVEAAILGLMALTCLAVVCWLGWLAHRVSLLEINMQELPTLRTTVNNLSKAGAAQVVPTPMPLANPVLPTGARAKPERDDDPELQPPVKSLTPETTSGRRSQTDKAKGPRPPADRRFNGNKRSENRRGKTGALPSRLGSPGSQILPKVTPKASPRPSIGPQ